MNVMNAAEPSQDARAPLGVSAAHAVASVGANAGKTALIMAGGTGGHIFPGLAVAEALRASGWQVQWLGAPGSMESRLVPPRGFALNTIDFSGVRGKGVLTFALLPVRLLKAFWQSIQVIRRVKPNVVVGLGGYISFPAGMMAVLLGKPLVLHEQNSVAGMANRVLAQVADKVFTAFPGVLTKGEWVGNPLRAEFLLQAEPSERFAPRLADPAHRLQLLVVGGSLGAKALNEIVPKALALLTAGQRPQVIHQSGEKQIDALRANYAAAGVEATLTPFIDNTAAAFAQADLIVCRAGASTVTEIAAVGAAALLVPFPFAVDDHQTTNARFLSDQGAALLVQQNDLTPEALSVMLQKSELLTLLSIGLKAKSMQKIQAVQAIVLACESLSSGSRLQTLGAGL
jgi:UDP-N-acetylglucosamine--N-acetylmuramyl-(pentapeptide) pyrophosphoryl-undecaprenol N-acetylglucosamine transferase